MSDIRDEAPATAGIRDDTAPGRDEPRGPGPGPGSAGAHADGDDGASANDLATGHDEHGEHAEPLGPIDWAAWGAGIVGIAAGLLVASCLYLSIGGL